MLTTIRRIALLVCIVPILVAAAANPIEAASGVSAAQVTVDFTRYGSQSVFDPLFFRSDGIAFPPRMCGPVGCDNWFVGYVQGDEALIGQELVGDIRATFSRPVSSLTLEVAQGLQGTAMYTLTAYDGSGASIASNSLTVVQDEGVAQPVPWGYNPISLTNLSRPAKSFLLEGRMVSSSAPQNTTLGYGVSTISYTHWPLRPLAG